jgi:hypothetical protein
LKRKLNWNLSKEVKTFRAWSKKTKQSIQKACRKK